MVRSVFLLGLSALVLLTACSKPAEKSATAPFDLIIAGGHVIDGSGNPWFAADIGVRSGKIAKIGDLSNVQAAERVDAAGLIVAPGFIDEHSHADDIQGRRTGLRSDDIHRREAVNIVTQGVTTVVVNPDGLGEVGLSIADQRAQIEAHGTGPNVILMAPHSAIRAQVLKDDYKRPATPEEITAMRALVRKAMEDGAFGLTSGLEYTPGRWSTTDELVALMEEVAPFHGPHISHMRSEADAPMWWTPSRDGGTPLSLMDAAAEIVAIAERSHTIGVITHMKARGEQEWGKSKDLIKLVEDARARGVQIYADQYPYDTSGSDGKLVLIPKWAIGMADDLSSVDPGAAAYPAPPRAQGHMDLQAALRATLANTQQRAALYKDVNYAIAFRGGAANIMVFDYPDKAYIGRSLQDLAKARKISDADMAIALQMEGYADQPGGARLRSFSLEQSDIETLMAKPWMATSSDGGIKLPEDGPAIHARYYGTFPRKFAHYVRERGAISIEQAVRASTSLPAQILGVKDRGLLREGMVADIVAFNADTIADAATFTDPHHTATGVDYVWVNGTAVVSGGKPSEKMPGQVLRPAR